jgi:hypothetical protein
MSVLSVAKVMATIDLPEINAQPVEEDPFSELGVKSHAYLIDRLTEYGQGISDDHSQALRGLMWLASSITEGRLSWRYRYALPCGMGKTTGVRAFLRTVAALGLPYRVTVACSQVEQLARLKRQLISEDGLDPSLIGLLHSYPVDPDRARLSPGYASEPSEGHDRQFLLVTHARVQVDDNGKPKAWIEGREDDLVFYDETLIVGAALTIPLLSDDGDNLMGDAARFKTALLVRPEYAPAAAWFDSVVNALYSATQEIRDGEVVTGTVPAISEEAAAAFLQLRPIATEKYPRLASIIEQARDGVAFRVFLDRTTNRALVSYTINVPDTLRNVIVLDASDPIREIVHYDYRMQRAEDVVPCLEKFRTVPGGIASIKRYDNVTIHYAEQASGRGATREEFAKPNSALLQKCMRVVKASNGPVLAFVFKRQTERDLNYARAMLEAAKRAGIDPYEVQERSNLWRLNVTTWGRETATNDYQDCETVLMPGVFFPRPDVVAGQYLGQVDDLKAPMMRGLVERLVIAESLHSFYQGASRGSLRRTVLVDGRSQAAPCDIYVAHPSPEFRSKVEQVFPGARWVPWREPAEHLGATEASLLIEQKLREFERQGLLVISLSRLKKAVDHAIPNGTWQRARDEALQRASWFLSGRSLRRFAAA